MKTDPATPPAVQTFAPVATTANEKFCYAENLAIFLMEKTNSVLTAWAGKLTYSEQRKLFGRALGKGRIVIDGEREIIFNRVKVCFGLDYDDRNTIRWADL